MFAFILLVEMTNASRVLVGERTKAREGCAKKSERKEGAFFGFRRRSLPRDVS